jgi:hypothetical protein
VAADLGGVGDALQVEAEELAAGLQALAEGLAGGEDQAFHGHGIGVRLDARIGIASGRDIRAVEGRTHGSRVQSHVQKSSRARRPSLTGGLWITL